MVGRELDRLVGENVFAKIALETYGESTRCWDLGYHLFLGKMGHS